MKKIKIFSTIFTAIIIIFSNSVIAYAAPQTMPDGNTFDAEYYAANNPDVVALFGTDVTALYNHYKSYGINEGRLPYDGAAVSSVKNSNVSASLAQARYDVFCVSVLDYTSDPAVLFDADYYLANYPDLATTIGTDYKLLFNHYINYGRFEGRTARMGIYPERGNVGLNYRDFDGSIKIYLPSDSWLKKQNQDIYIIEYLDKVLNNSMSEREIVTIIHDEICNRTTYGFEPDINNNFENGTMYLICDGYSS